MTQRPSSVAQVNALGSVSLGVTPAALGPPTRVSTLQGLQRSIPVYYIGPGVPEDEARDILTVMFLYGRSTSSKIKDWQTWVLTWSCCCFPQLVPKFRAMRSAEYLIAPLPDTFTNDVRTAMAQLAADPGAKIAAPLFPHFPGTSATLSWEYYNCGNLEGIYGYYALMVHLMGKKIDASTRDAITTRRPGNIIDTFRCASSSFVLRGPGRIGDTGHDMIRNAWDLSTAPRKVIIEEYSLFASVDDQTAQIVNLMFRMLEYSGMQPSLFIKDFLSACPWAIPNIPALAPAYDVYVNSVFAFSSLDPTLRPYTKLFHGNNTRIFHAKSMQDLTALAVDWLSVNNDSMTGYTAPGGDKVKAAFWKLAQAKGIDVNTGAINTDYIQAAQAVEGDEE